MYDQEQIIQIYRQGFFICAGLSVVGGIMTTIFFFEIWDSENHRSTHRI